MKISKQYAETGVPLTDDDRFVDALINGASHG